MTVISFALIAGGIGGGILGTLLGNDNVAWCGLFLSAVGLPLVIVRAIREALMATADQLAQADINGYRRALRHVAAGLLDQDAAPSPEPGAPVSNLATNVISLHPPHRAADVYERKAQ
jgi:hypothetical protein